VRFIGDLAARAFVTIQVDEDDWLRIAELVSRYRDLPLGTVDASIIAAAERLGIVTIATLDRRQLSVVRSAHIAAFESSPDISIREAPERFRNLLRVQGDSGSVEAFADHLLECASATERLPGEDSAPCPVALGAP